MTKKTCTGWRECKILNVKDAWKMGKEKLIKVSAREFVNKLLAGELDFSRIKLGWSKTSLGGFHFAWETEQSLKNIDFSGIDFSGSNLNSCSFQKMSPDGRYERLKFRNANFEGAYMPCTELYNLILTGANFRGAYLRGAHIQRCNLRNADLREADLRGIYKGNASEFVKESKRFYGAESKAHQLKDCNNIFRPTQVVNNDLRNADLRAAKFSWCTYFHGSNLDGALFSEFSDDGAPSGLRQKTRDFRTIGLREEIEYDFTTFNES